MTTFGDKIRKLRIEKRFSQRDLADYVDIDFTYLSKIENGKVDPPSEEVIDRLAKALETDKEELLNLAPKLSTDELREAVERNPSVGVLFRKLQSKDLTRDQIKRMLEIAQEDTG